MNLRRFFKPMSYMLVIVQIVLAMSFAVQANAEAQVKPAPDGAKWLRYESGKAGETVEITTEKIAEGDWSIENPQYPIIENHPVMGWQYTLFAPGKPSLGFGQVKAKYVMNELPAGISEETLICLITFTADINHRVEANFHEGIIAWHDLRTKGYTLLPQLNGTGAVTITSTADDSPESPTTIRVEQVTCGEKKEPVNKSALNGLLKTDGSNPLAGAVFEVRDLPQGFNLIAAESQLTSGTDGRVFAKVTWQDGPDMITAKLCEVQAPSGYNLAQNQCVELTFTNGVNSFPNQPAILINNRIPMMVFAGGKDPIFFMGFYGAEEYKKFIVPAAGIEALAYGGVGFNIYGDRLITHADFYGQNGQKILVKNLGFKSGQERLDMETEGAINGVVVSFDKVNNTITLNGRNWSCSVWQDRGRTSITFGSFQCEAPVSAGGWGPESVRAGANKVDPNLFPPKDKFIFLPLVSR